MIGSNDLQKDVAMSILIRFGKSQDKVVCGKAGFLRAWLEERSEGDSSAIQLYSKCDNATVIALPASLHRAHLLMKD